MSSESVTVSERLWSEEVGIADADAPVQTYPVWQFSNGRCFQMAANVFSLPEDLPT